MKCLSVILMTFALMQTAFQMKGDHLQPNYSVQTHKQMSQSELHYTYNCCKGRFSGLPRQASASKRALNKLLDIGAVFLCSTNRVRALITARALKADICTEYHMK